MSEESLLSYYQKHGFDPVPIEFDSQAAWESHVAKRRNLYERHLGLPLAFFRGRSVLEFGPNVGQNALVLAAMGATLTLVEPNHDALRQIRGLFERFGLQGQLQAVLPLSLEQLETDVRYDVVLAEGFLFTLPQRNALLSKIAGLLSPGGIAVVSFNDRHGMFLELMKRTVLFRACELAGIRDMHSPASLEMAQTLFSREFSRLNTSRPLAAWWKDTLVNPLANCVWGVPELLALLEGQDCDFRASSPQWGHVDDFNWYKNVLQRTDRHARVLAEWVGAIPYLLTGLPSAMALKDQARISDDVLVAIDEVVAAICRFAREGEDRAPVETLVYPEALATYLERSSHVAIAGLHADLRLIFRYLCTGSLDELTDAYLGTAYLQRLWGVPYQYLSFARELEFPTWCS